MKIALTGTHCNGKSTLVKEILQKWPMYKTPSVTYRDILAEKQLNINEAGDEKSQRAILDALIDEAQKASVSDDKHIIFDRCVIDNIVYSLWLNSKGKVSDSFIMDCKFLVTETVKLFDIIFFLPLKKEIKIEEKTTRSNDPLFREEIDNIFHAVIESYSKNAGVFFPRKDCPAVITLEGPPDLRCEQIRLYLKDSGSPFGEEDGSLIYV
jgi:thymidylate kinase